MFPDAIKARPRGPGSGRYLGGVLLALVLLQGVGIAQEPRELYRQAVSLMDRGEWASAVQLLQRVASVMPGNARIHNNLGIALSSAGEATAAASAFRRALELDPAYPSPLRNLALHEMSRGRPGAARPYFERLLELSPDEPFAHVGLAEIAFGEGDHPAAVRHFEQSHGLLVRDPRLLVNFAAALVGTGQPAKATMALDRLPASTPPETRFQAGIMLAGVRQFAAAARQFELAEGGQVDPYEAGFNLVLAYQQMGRNADAARTGERLLAAGHGTAELHNLLAKVYDGKGDLQEAYDSLRTATELAPGDETNYVDLIALCLDRESFDLGVEIADIAVGRLPRSHRLHLQRGVALAMKGRFDDARQAFERARELDPGSSLSQSALGLILMQQDRLPEAVEVLRARRDQAPADHLVLWFLAEALHRSGVEPGTEGEAEAVGALRESVAQNAELFQSRLLLGRMLARRGDLDGALLHLEKARSIDPDEVSAVYQLAMVHRRLGDSEKARVLFQQVGQQKAEDREQFTRRGLLRMVRVGSP